MLCDMLENVGVRVVFHNDEMANEAFDIEPMALNFLRIKDGGGRTTYAAMWSNHGLIQRFNSEAHSMFKNVQHLVYNFPSTVLRQVGELFYKIDAEEKISKLKGFGKFIEDKIDDVRAQNAGMMLILDKQRYDLDDAAKSINDKRSQMIIDEMLLEELNRDAISLSNEYKKASKKTSEFRNKTLELKAKLQQSKDEHHNKTAELKDAEDNVNVIVSKIVKARNDAILLKKEAQVVYLDLEKATIKAISAVSTLTAKNTEIHEINVKIAKRDVDIAKGTMSLNREIKLTTADALMKLKTIETYLFKSVESIEHPDIAKLNFERALATWKTHYNEKL